MAFPESPACSEADIAPVQCDPLTAQHRPPLILRRPLDVIDDKYLHRTYGRIHFEPELIFQGLF